MSGAIQVMTTLGSQHDAEQMASDLVDRRLAACVQIVGPIHSTYRWQGRVETSQEWMCIIKTRADRYSALEQAILAAHPYDMPEIVSVPIVGGSQAYCQWLDESVASTEE
jgi:periplasmic divalent cation tolerance protein